MNPRHPGAYRRVILQQDRDGRVGIDEPQRVIPRQIGDARLVTEQKLPVALQLGFQLAHQYRPLGKRHVRVQPRGGAAGKQGLAILDEFLHDLLGQLGETRFQRMGLEIQRNGMLEQHLVAILRQCRRDGFLALRKQRQHCLLPLQTSGNQRRITIDVGTHLQHRGTPVAPSERNEVRLGHDRRDEYRAPGQGLDPKHQPGLFSEGRLRVVMQYQLVHDNLGSVHRALKLSR